MNTDKTSLENESQPSCLGVVSGSAEYWLTAPMEEVKAYLAENTNKADYEQRKSALMDKIEDLRRRQLTDKYIETHCSNYSDKEKAIAVNALQVGWDMRKHYR